ncbi:MAG: helix-turn-helix transcriptional regulator [Tannerella sp.]|jgi:AraC-like DNA-binding protein|nr:helix-turn-helix transcriptional regulator [Tannerella sp.]
MESELLPNIGRVKDVIVYHDNFKDDTLILEFDYSLYRETKPIVFPPPSRHEALTFLGIMAGELDISVDYSPYRIPVHGIVWIMPTHIMQITDIAPDTKIWMLRISKSFMDDNLQQKFGNTPMILYMQLKKNPYSVFDPEEFKSLYNSLQVIREKFKLHAHLYQKEMIRIFLKAFVLDMAHFFFRKKDNLFTPQLTRKEELFADFLPLLSTHCREQHAVSFYADKLHITPQYLSLILREQSGRSASQWIQSALVVEARRMLKIPRTTIQKVADDLHFPDQSTFGKFFKKHTGFSPFSFRKS